MTGDTELDREIAEWEAWKKSPPAVLAWQYAKGGLEFDAVGLEAFYAAAYAAGEAAERDRTARLVEDMQAELQALRDRLARQKPTLWAYKDNPQLTTMREPSNPNLWEPLGPIV